MRIVLLDGAVGDITYNYCKFANNLSTDSNLLQISHYQCQAEIGDEVVEQFLLRKSVEPYSSLLGSKPSLESFLPIGIQNRLHSTFTQRALQAIDMNEVRRKLPISELVYMEHVSS